jgi:hypothetical protein
MSDPQIRNHSQECKDCSRVVTLLIGGERDLATLLNQGSPTKLPSDITQIAITRARRHRLGVGFSAVLTVLLAATIWIAWLRLVVPGMHATAEMTSSHQQTETLPLKCLSPADAGALISPYVRANGSLYYLPTGSLRVITVRATPDEMRRVKSLLGRFDSGPAGSCSGVPHPPRP